MLLKIESADDLIARHAPTHTRCGKQRTVKLSEKGDTVDVDCTCGITFAFGVEYLADCTLHAWELEDAARYRESRQTKNAASKKTKSVKTLRVTLG